MTLESLPSKVLELERKIDLLLERSQPAEEKDRMLTINELCDYLPEHPAKQTVYGWVWDRRLPYEKHGRNLYFKKSLIDNWLANGRKI